jgi:vacuolar-type H+-ATPase subunit I/STV1
MQIEDLWRSLENAVQDLNDKTKRFSKKGLEEIKGLSNDASDVLKFLHQLEWLESNKRERNGEEVKEEEPFVSQEMLEEKDDILADEEVIDAIKEIEQQMEQSINLASPSMRVPGQSLAEKLSQTKVHDLTKAFGISEKFLFMNELFEGDSDSYKEALNTLNNFPSWNLAEEELLKLSEKFSWDQESEFVNRFMTVVERRYA